MQEFDRVYREYFDTVYGYVLRLSHDQALAEEVTQEAFFRALPEDSVWKPMPSWEECRDSGVISRKI